ncbi:uncharacterized protein LOC127789631 [Diospyros lotus]|uniref:uncharacterized protein LOC127789631 n=1 Tax=Diospyros lotus TaxID=55363 RepID=UPI00225025F8|nr:uncharacterized protein LOC127789631 [Diospyros lotus]
MEIVAEDGSKILLKKGCKKEMGRGALGFDSKDRTVSRRHVMFELHRCGDETLPERVYVEAIGKNPIWVYNRASNEIKVFRRSEGGEMDAGDMLCLSAEKPLWFTLKAFSSDGEDDSEIIKKKESERELGLKNENQLVESLHNWRIGHLELDSIDVSDIDPVKEFGFLVMEHEFDHYPKQMIRHPRAWNWFLEELEEDSINDEVLKNKGKNSTRRKRKKDGDSDDKEWTGESEDVEKLQNLKKAQRPKYSTRLKDRNKTVTGTEIDRDSVPKEANCPNEGDEEADDTLGGFIVKDEYMEEAGEEIDEEEEEEDFDDDDDDNED